MTDEFRDFLTKEAIVWQKMAAEDYQLSLRLGWPPEARRRAAISAQSCAGIARRHLFQLLGAEDDE